MGRIVGDTAIVVILLGATLQLKPRGRHARLSALLRGTGSTLTSYVYNNSPAGEGNAPEKAYAAAFVLLLIVIAPQLRGRPDRPQRRTQGHGSDVTRPRPTEESASTAMPTDPSPPTPPPVRRIGVDDAPTRRAPAAGGPVASRRRAQPKRAPRADAVAPSGCGPRS